MNQTTAQHTSVLLREAIDALHLNAGNVVVDATAGSGGHSVEIAERIGEKGTLVLFDVDRDALRRTEASLSPYELKRYYVLANFRCIEEELKGCEIDSVDGIVADLGWSIEQFEGSGKGFSFKNDEPLIMSLAEEPPCGFSAKDIVNEWSEEDIANVLYGYGEERYARKISRSIVEKRKGAPIETSVELAEIVSGAVPGAYRRGRIHPATKTFQALRIAINDELEALKEFIDGSYRVLAPGKRLAIITFHSIEDRIVKQRFKELENETNATIVTKKPMTPAREEVTRNPRARSAKLRILEKHE